MSQLSVQVEQEMKQKRPKEVDELFIIMKSNLQKISPWMTGRPAFEEKLKKLAYMDVLRSNIIRRHKEVYGCYIAGHKLRAKDDRSCLCNLCSSFIFHELYMKPIEILSLEISHECENTKQNEEKDQPNKTVDSK